MISRGKRAVKLYSKFTSHKINCVFELIKESKVFRLFLLLLCWRKTTGNMKIASLVSQHTWKHKLHKNWIAEIFHRHSSNLEWDYQTGSKIIKWSHQWYLPKPKKSVPAPPALWNYFAWWMMPLVIDFSRWFLVKQWFFNLVSHFRPWIHTT